MTSAEMTKLGIALAVCFAAFKYSGSQAVKGAALAVGAVVVAKRLPYVGAALA